MQLWKEKMEPQEDENNDQYTAYIIWRLHAAADV